MDPAPPPVIINEEEEYEVEEVWKHRTQGREHNTWYIGRVMVTNMING